MNISTHFINAVKYINYHTPKYFSSYRITRIPLEEKVPLNFKLINEKLLELHEIDTSSRSKILETYDVISNSNVKKVLDDFYYTQLLKQTSNLCLTFIPEDYTKIFNSFRNFPKLIPECVKNLNLGVQRLSKNFTTEQIAILMRSYAHIKSRSLNTITELIETFNKKCHNSEVWELREITSALATLNVPVKGSIKEFYDYTVSILPKYLKSMEVNDIAIFVNSFCSQKIQHNEILHYIDMNCNNIINKIYPKGLALILNSFARNNKLSDNLMLITSKKLIQILENKESDMYNRMNIIDISMIFNSFVKLEYFDQKLFNSYIPWLLDKIKEETPTLSLVLLVHAYAQSGIKSKDLFSKVAHYLVYRISQFNPQKLGVVSLSFAKIGYAPPLLFHRIADEIIYRGTIGLKYSRYEFSFRSLEQITQAFSRIGFKDNRLFSVLTTLLKTRFKTNNENITGEMVASLMLSISKNKVNEFIPFISQILEKVKDYTAFSTIALTKVISSFNKLGIKNNKLINRFLKETKDRVNQFPPSILINAFKSLSKLGCYDNHLIKETLKRCSLHLATLSTIDLTNLSYSLAEFSYRNVSFLKKLSVCVNYQMNNFNKQQLHILFTRFALLRISDLDLMNKLVERISLVQHEFNEIELAEICLSIVYVITHFDCLNKEINKRDNNTDNLVYKIPDRFYNVQDHLLSLFKQKLDVSTIFKLKTIYIYLKNMKPEKYSILSKKSKEILEKADIVQFNLAEYLLTSSSVHKEISYYFNMIGIIHKNEIQFGPYLIDIVPEINYKVAIEYDGPSHFYCETLMRNIKSILKHEILSNCGWKVIHIPYQEWAQLVDEKQKIIYLNRIKNEIIREDLIR